ncbi:hypothetical protein [Streptomyces sp. NPDC002851]
MGRPPVLSYASHVLVNWRRLDPARPVELGNVARLQSFLGGLDEDWFVVVHIAIEALAGPGLFAAARAQQTAAENDMERAATHLRTRRWATAAVPAPAPGVCSGSGSMAGPC